MIFGERHLLYLLDQYLIHFHEERPHQGLGNRPPCESEPPPEIVRFGTEEIVCRERLGGLLKHYERKAA
jgi:putative transposase